MEELLEHLTLITPTFNRTEIAESCKQLLECSFIMEPILADIADLQRGIVDPNETKKRSKVGSFFSGQAQQILHFAHRNNISIKKDVEEGLRKIIGMGEAILRENIVLQSKGPLDVISFSSIPRRYAYNPEGKKELRAGFGLHKFPTTEQGNSLSMAFMPPHHTQIFHNHTVSEYTFAIDKPTVGIAQDKKIKKRNYALANEILYFSAGTVHSLRNASKQTNRNITVKSPIGVLDWKPFFGKPEKRESRSAVVRGNDIHTLQGVNTLFSINDRFYDYTLEIRKMKKQSVLEHSFAVDRYFLVLDGSLTVSTGGIKKECKANDYIVIDRNTAFQIKTESGCRLYSPSILTTGLLL